MKVRCCSCGCTDLYETTDKYNPDIPLTGDQLCLQEPYKSYSWNTYDGALGDKSTPRFRMLCTRCCGFITTSGKLSIVDEPKMVEKPKKVTQEKRKVKKVRKVNHGKG